MKKEEKMKGLLKKGYVFGILAVLAMLVGAVGAQAKLVPKVDNFIIFPDQSGSMYMTHQALKEVKMAATKRLLLDMNNLIPELGYKGSLYLFAPFQQVQAPMVYKSSDMAASVAKIKSDQEIFGRLTPMGPGIHQLDGVLAQLPGKTAVIMISDGEANKGTDPVMEATRIHQKYPNVCFHVISFAETKKGKTINEQVARIGNCILVEGTELLSSQTALDQFVRDVFYDEVPEKDEVIVLRGIQFDFDKSNIKPEWRPVLDEGARVLKENPNVKVVIEGHTCSIGTDSYNLGLSERRAKSVEDYFVAKGISKNRMSTVGFGERKPIADNSTEEGRRLNRRVEIKVVK